MFNINDSFDHLKQDKKSDIQILSLIDGDMSFLIAELKPGKTLAAHYHNEGSEIYHILSGQGKMKTGKLFESGVLWTKDYQIQQGDVFEIKPCNVHRLSNTGEEKLKIVFITPPSHLSDDRIFINP